MKVHNKHTWPVILITLCLVSFLVISSTVGFVSNDAPNRVERITPNPENNDQTQVFDIEIDQGSIYDGKPQAVEPQRAQTSYVSRSGTRKADTCWPMLSNTADRIGVSSSAIPGSGAVLWSNKTALSYASPVTANNRVFMATNAGYIACYEETTGNLCWQTQLSIKTNNSAVSTPAVSSGFIIAFCSGDGTLYKLNIYTGEINWTYKLPGKGTTINAAHIDYPILIYQGQVLFGAPNKYFYCLNETTGKLVWRFKTLQGLSYDYGITSGAAAFGSSIYFGANDGYLYAMDLDGFLDSVNDGPWQLEGVNISNTDGDVLWKFFTGDSICSTPAVINNYVYVTVGIHDSSFSNYNIFKIFCINRNTGLLVWEYQTENHLVSSPAIEGDKVIFGSLDGKIYCLTTTSNTSQWKPFPTTGEVWSSPAVSIAGLGGKLVVGATDGKLYCIYTHNGVSDWQRILDGAITSSPALGNNRIFVNTRKGTLYCLGAADTELPKIINTTPMVDEINVPVSNYITITFDEPIK
ncbi:MAG: PQQ-binding-like beta-propeller repeat protein, partial [Thermoplasmata archaeon]|nr:PQQ-binding-like beta-propeller repeat protein [Thermoplasmata archaeon]